MTYTSDERGMIWLCACSGLELRERAALLRAANNEPTRLFEKFEEFFVRVIKSSERRVYKEGGLATREKEIEETLARMEGRGQFAVTCFDDDYPEALLRTPEPPLVLFGMGNRELLRCKMFCIVGSRTTPAWAEAQGRKIAEKLAKKLVIVTGIAEGGDSAAIRGALASGNLISVLPNGLDECYPAAHAALKEEIKRKGLLLSECPFSEKVHKGSFHARNRILAGLSQGVLVLSAAERSGTLITANKTLDYGRDVFAFPYSLGIKQGEGCNALIKNGAYLCTGEEDILAAYGFTLDKDAPADLSTEEAKVHAVLASGEAVHAATIAEQTGLPVYEIAGILASLEIKGLAVKAGGNRYSIVK